MLLVYFYYNFDSNLLIPVDIAVYNAYCHYLKLK